MKITFASWLSCCLFALGACGDSTPTPADASSDLAADIPRDMASDTPADAPPQTCPPGPGHPTGSCTQEGIICDYNDRRPECGGIRMTCRSGLWAEVYHTDPAASCFDSGAPDASADARDDQTTDVTQPDAADGGDASVNACESSRGICVSSASSCAAVNGTVSTAGAPGCRFSDGDGVCCVPPAPQATGDACGARGGVCAPIAGCNFVHGSFGPLDGAGCTGVGVVCCLPRAICGDENVTCCGATASFRPACDRGTWRCTISGTTLVPAAMCRF